MQSGEGLNYDNREKNITKKKNCWCQHQPILTCINCWNADIKTYVSDNLYQNQGVSETWYDQIYYFESWIVSAITIYISELWKKTKKNHIILINWVKILSQCTENEHFRAINTVKILAFLTFYRINFRNIPVLQKSNNGLHNYNHLMKLHCQINGGFFICSIPPDPFRHLHVDIKDGGISGLFPWWYNRGFSHCFRIL